MKIPSARRCQHEGADDLVLPRHGRRGHDDVRAGGSGGASTMSNHAELIDIADAISETDPVTA